MAYELAKLFVIGGIALMLLQIELIVVTVGCWRLAEHTTKLEARVQELETELAAAREPHGGGCG